MKQAGPGVLRFHGLRGCLLGLLAVLAFSAQAVTIEWLTVGDPGNGDNTSGGFGGVAYEYRISNYEITNEQYIEFLNAVADTDTYGLWNSYMGLDNGSGSPDHEGGISRSGAPGSYTYAIRSSHYNNKPVSCITWYNALRFCNWLQNGQPTGAQGALTTEDGAYTLTSTNAPDPDSLTRNAGALCFLPTRDEWEKAAFYDPRSEAEGGPPGDDHYWAYTTMSDTQPVNEAPPGGTNSSRYNNLGAYPSRYEVVGAFVNTKSYYGAHDMSNNAKEMTEDSNGSGSIYITGRDPYQNACQTPGNFPTVNPAIPYLYWGSFRVAASPPPAPPLPRGTVVTVR